MLKKISLVNDEDLFSVENHIKKISLIKNQVA